jgi:hypothetical protein
MKNVFFIFGLLQIFTLQVFAQNQVSCDDYNVTTKTCECDGYAYNSNTKKCVEKTSSSATVGSGGIRVDPCQKTVEQQRINRQINLSLPSKSFLPLNSCEYLYYASKIAGEEQMGATDSISSSDRAIVCTQKAGYTLDFNSCKVALKAYNNVLIAERALQMQQGVRQQLLNDKVQSDVNKQLSAGDGQTAAFDATAKTSQNLANLNKEQAALYASAVAYLGNTLNKWVRPNAAGFTSICSSNRSAAETLNTEYRTDCLTALQQAYNYRKNVVFANESAKDALKIKGIELATKSLNAGIQAANLQKNVNDLKKMRDNLGSDPKDEEKCKVYPGLPECRGAGPRVPGDGYGGPSFGLAGGTGGGGSFEFGGEGSEFGEPGAPTTIGAENVDPMTSPFEDEAKIASGILDPAAAASINPGTPGAGAGGGGGVGGGGGGGGASLGNDLEGVGAAETKDTDIKAQKFSGGYASQSGGGFQALKDSKDENPLAGLFDGKSDGGIEEEGRGIASDDIGGQDSGLFRKISERYGQVQADKRIESINLE